MVGDDDVDAALDRAPHRVHAGNAAVDRDDQLHIPLSQNAFQHFQLQAVAVDQAVRNDMRRVGADRAKNRLQENDGSDAVDVIVAVDEDGLTVAHRSLDTVAGGGHTVNPGWIVQILSSRRDKAAVFLF